MSDLISRQDAIEALGEEPEVWTDTEEEWAYHNAWVEHISALKALPSASQNLAEPNKTMKGSDLISRQDAIEAVCRTRCREKAKGCPAHSCPVIEEFDALPSAEPKTGEWILDQNGMDWNIPAWRCSECGFVANYIGVEANGLGNNPLNWAGSKFCPQCGARITGYER